MAIKEKGRDMIEVIKFLAWLIWFVLFVYTEFNNKAVIYPTILGVLAGTPIAVLAWIHWRS